MGTNQWVSPRDGKWAVHGEGNQRATKIFDRQSDAAAYARDIAINQKSEVIIQVGMVKSVLRTVMAMTLALRAIRSISHILVSTEPCIQQRQILYLL